MEQFKLQFKGFEVTKIVFDRDASVKAGNFNVDIQHIGQVQENDKKKFRTIFVVTIISPAEPLFNFQVQAVGDFEIIGDPEEKIYTNFINISAPSIVYPYIRTFISTTMLQSGVQPVIIPPLNFGAMPPAKAITEPITEKK